MFSSEKYLLLANQAELDAQATTNPELRRHFETMASQWKRLAGLSGTVEDHAQNRQAS